MRMTTCFTRASRAMFAATLLLLMLAQAMMLATAAEDLGSWQKRMPITFSGYTPGRETLTNFPVLVILSNTTAGIGFNYSDFLSSPYGDLRFAASDKTTQLDFEVEFWNTNGLSYAWVRVPELTNNLKIYALWSKSGVAAPACTTNGAVWDANFKAVWHFANGSVLSGLDCTSNRNDCTSMTGVTATNGRVDGAAGFATAQTALTPVATSFADFTAEVWFKDDGVISDYERLIDKKYDTGFWVGRNASLANTWGGGVLEAGSPYGVYVTLTDGAWHQIVSLRRGTTHYMYGDGGAASAFNTVSASSLDATQVRIGNGTTGQGYGGIIDEVRVSSTARSSNWIWGCYMNMASNGVFNTYGVPESQGGPSVANSNAVVTASYVTLNGALVSTGQDANVSAAVYWGTNDAGGSMTGWAYTNRFPSWTAVGPMSTNVTPSLGGRRHYFRFFASNSMGSAWASPAGTFSSTGAPSVNNAGGAINVGTVSATLQGEVTGGSPEPFVWIYWGTVNQGTTKVLWEHETSVGIVSNWTFASTVGGLAPGATYYYTCYASNIHGAAWATVSNFTSLGGVSRIWNGAGANALASNPTNWVGNAAPSAGDDVILDSRTNKNMTWDMNIILASWTQSGYTGTVTVATVYGTTGFTNLNILGNCIISNGVWTHVANPAVNNEVNRLSVTIGGNLIVGTNGAINVLGKGYTNGRGPGYIANSIWNSGGYGGFASGPCYGSIVAPTNLGSGSWNVSGGGAIMVMARGTIRNDGLICADGSPNVEYSQSGSGGSVYLTAGTLIGGGVIRANGGGNGGAGGGGRIALVVTNTGVDFSGFTGTNSAFGAGASRGCAGTIYLEKQSDVPGKGELIVNNSGGARGYAAANTDLNGLEAVTYEFSRITLTNGANLNIGLDDTLIMTNTVLVSAGYTVNGIWISGGTLRVPPVFAYSNMFVTISATGSTFNPATSLTIPTNAELRVDKLHEMTGDVIIEAGGNLTHTANSSTEAYKINLIVNGSMTIQTGGSVNVSGKGYAAGYGPGYDSSAWNGASYGGRGSASSCYGSIVAPTNLGSGGTFGPGSGGGVVLLRVAGTLRNDGIIRSDGVYGDYSTAGSGGSVFLVSGMLVGAGTIRANGVYNGKDGGGRISLAVTNALADFSGFTGSITAYGGAVSQWAAAGGAGTVYLRTATQGLYEGTLIVDNNGTTVYATEISSNVTDTVVGDVVIRNQGYLLLCANQTLTVKGIWSNRASFASQWGSQVIFAGNAASTSAVYGSNVFMGLTCTNTTGKTILFEAGRTNTLPAQGRLTLKGSEITTNLVLRSTSDGTPWKLNVNALADQSVVCVDVKDSDALPGVGAPVIALNSFDQGGNTNWFFMQVVPDETNTWTGNSNTVWSLSANWSLARPPTEDDFILIPAACPRYPLLDNNRIVNGFEIQHGASLSLAGYNLTSKKAAAVAGAIVASGTETISFQNNADFTGGGFMPERSRVLFTGNGNQNINPDNLTFFKVEVLNSAGIVAFSNGFSATEFRCEAAGGSRNISFQQGASVVLRDLVLLGSTTSTNIFLRSSSFGQPWNLAVSGYRWSVRGVNVQDSDASHGLPIPAAASKDGGNNTNWFFNETRSVWLGTSSVNFHTAANWLSGVVPDSSSRVLVESASPMTVTGAVTLLDLTVGGGAGAASMTVSAPLTVIEDIVVLTNGTLALNRPCVVSNGLYVFAGGVLTHSANTTTEANKLDVTVYGNVGVDVNAIINVTGKGYAAGNGPGFDGSVWNGASYGGHGSGGRCYGSILAPTNLGSGGSFAPGSGGGAIIMRVAGTLRHDGLMCSDGVFGDYSTAGSGGSIFLTSGALTGIGNMRANGVYNGKDGGGRIALLLANAGADFSAFRGTVTVYGGAVSSWAAAGGAGTIYRQRASDRPGYGTVLVDNNNSVSNLCTYVPPSPPGNFTNETEFAPFHLTNAAILRLTNDFMIGDIYLKSANTRLDLGSNTLTVRSRAHALGLGSVTNYGAIIWWPDIPKGIVFSTW